MVERCLERYQNAEPSDGTPRLFPILTFFSVHLKIVNKKSTLLNNVKAIGASRERLRALQLQFISQYGLKVARYLGG